MHNIKIAANHRQHHKLHDSKKQQPDGSTITKYYYLIVMLKHMQSVSAVMSEK